MFPVSRTSSSDSSLFPEEFLSEPEVSRPTMKPTRSHSRRFRSRLANSASQNSKPSDPPLPSHGNSSGPGQLKLAKMIKGVSEVLEENTRLKKKRFERETRRSTGLKARANAKPYDATPGERSTSGKTSRRVSETSGKEPAKPLDAVSMSTHPAPKRSRQVSVSKGKEAAKVSYEDMMDIDPPVTLVDAPMNEDPLPKSVETKLAPSSSDSQSSAKMMPPPPVPSKVLKQPPTPKSPSKPTPSKVPNHSQLSPPPPSLTLTQSNPPRGRQLGMTRTTTQTSTVPRSLLPANRKPFKSPLIKQEPIGPSQSGELPRSQSRTYPVPTPSTPSQPDQKPTPAKTCPKQKKQTKSDPSEVIEIVDDPDTSYEFSTSSIDGEELDRMMAQYDQVSW